jgi:hypothetical protein
MSFIVLAGGNHSGIGIFFHGLNIIVIALQALLHVHPAALEHIQPSQVDFRDVKFTARTQSFADTATAKGIAPCI